MENNEIMTNEEVMETTEEIVKVSSANGFKKAAAFGLVFIAGYVAGKYIIDPAVARIKARRLNKRTVEQEFDDFEEEVIVNEETVEGDPA